MTERIMNECLSWNQSLDYVGDVSAMSQDSILTVDTIKRWMLEDGSGILYGKKNAGVFTGYITLTPERIALALKSNVRNRKLQENQIATLMDAINGGDWDENVSKINFDEHMVLSDGQHRITAFERLGVTIRVLVTVGLKESAQSVTDRRGNRTLEDDLGMKGVPNYRKMATLSRMCRAIENGATVKQMIEREGRVYAKTSDINLQRYYFSNQKKMQRLKKVCQHIYRQTRELHINGSVINVLGYSFDRINEDDARAFWDLLGSGVYDDENSPIRQLRQRLVANATSGTQKIPRRVVAALIIKAWNLWQKGETVKQLKFTSGGASPEPFPEIYNPYENE